MKFSEKLIKLRKTNGYTQENLAERLGVSRQAVARWEAGETTPDMAMLLGLCEVFSVSADYLIHDDYESDEDIPVVKEKNREITAKKEKEKMLTMLAGVLYAVAAACFLIAAILKPHPVGTPLCILSVGINTGLSAYWFIRFSKIKST